MNSSLTIRNSRPADASALRRLAALDSKTLPQGDMLVAEIAGEVVAAYSPERSRTSADPFRRTADVVELLRVWGREAHSTATRAQRHGLLPRVAA